MSSRRPSTKSGQTGFRETSHQSGVKVKLLNLFGDILKNRQLSIQIENENSNASEQRSDYRSEVLFALFCSLLFVSDLFNGLKREKFKFTDDGNLRVIADTEPQPALNFQIILIQLEVWCR